MKRVELKVTRIGNSRGVRIPAPTLLRYRIGDSVVMEERTDGILLRPAGESVARLSWAETASEMAASGEDWSEWTAADADGLDAIPWSHARPGRVAEPEAGYQARTRKRKK